MTRYGTLLTTWVTELRERFENDKMHFLAVQLPGWGVLRGGRNPDQLHPEAHHWAWFREAQDRLLELPHSGVAVTIDTGDIKDVHPKDKGPIGRRTALLALRDVYGHDVVASGPRYEKASFEGRVATVHFRECKTLKTTDEQVPRGFWMCGEDRQWRPATASIKGRTVVLKAEEVPNPIAVRYAFAGKPDVNLVNEAGLPAAPFRTDDWPPSGDK
jgi:sialate O-acetylesterase